MTKASMQIYAIKRAGVVLAVESHLSTASPGTPDPLERQAYSRFVLQYHSTKENKHMKANIPAADVFYIAKMTDFALERLVLCKLGECEKTQVTIYEQKFKYLLSNKDKEGRSFCYSIKMHLDPTRQYPFGTEIISYYARLEKGIAGYKPVDGTSTEKSRAFVAANEAEFVGLTGSMESTLKAYEYATFPGEYEKQRKAADAEKEAYLASR
jgi:hypothetical protein